MLASSIALLVDKHGFTMLVSIYARSPAGWAFEQSYLVGRHTFFSLAYSRISYRLDVLKGGTVGIPI